MIKIFSKGKSHLFKLALFLEEKKMLNRLIVLWPSYKFRQIKAVSSYFLVDIILRKFSSLKVFFFGKIVFSNTKKLIIDVNLLKYLPLKKMDSVIIDMPTMYWKNQIISWNKEEAITGIKIKRMLNTYKYLHNTDEHFSKAKNIVVPNHKSLKSLPKNLRSKTLVIPFLGLELPLKFKLSFSENLSNIICIGIVCPSKGWHYMIRALNRLDDYFSINFYGETNDDYISYLNSLASPKLFLKFYGHIPQKILFNRIHESDLCIHPSVSEGLPLSLLHCLKRGTPVFCSFHSNLDDIIPKEFIYDTYDIDDFVNKFRSLPKNIIIEYSQNTFHENEIRRLWLKNLQN